MADRIYPRMSYHIERPNDPGQVVRDVAHDMRLELGWDDPYQVRSATSIEDPTIEPPKKNKGGRPRKVQP